MYPSVQSPRDGDARVADAQRFMSDVEDLADRSRPGDPPPRFDRIDGPDRTGTVCAVVDGTGRFIDLELDPGWWAALGPGLVAGGVTEALEAARMKASLVWLVLRRHGERPSPDDRRLPLPRPDAGRRLRDTHSVQVVAGPRGLVRLHVIGRRIERIEVEQCGLTADDTQRLAADFRDALTRSSPSTRLK